MGVGLPDDVGPDEVGAHVDCQVSAGLDSHLVVAAGRDQALTLGDVGHAVGPVEVEVLVVVLVLHF